MNQLRTEHSTLLGRLTDMNQKYDAAAVDNRILRADIETLRTKVHTVTSHECFKKSYNTQEYDSVSNVLTKFIALLQSCAG